MRAVFLDTSAWFAALNVRDAHHRATFETYQRDLAGGPVRLVTSNLVVAEMHALLARQDDGAALRFLDHLYADPAIEVVHATRELERGAADRWLRPFRGRGFSLTDAVSFQLMTEQAVDTAFTLDAHFGLAGFHMVPQLKRGRRR